MLWTVGKDTACNAVPVNPLRIIINTEFGKQLTSPNQQQAELASDAGSGPKPNRLAGLRVLLVEDVADSQLLLTCFLRADGADVEAADNGSAALAMIHTKTYDMILMDLQMPIMDGYQATAELRKSGYLKPIVAVTARAMREDRQRCLDEGFSGYISKPIDRQALIETIAMMCARPRAETPTLVLTGRRRR